MRGITKVFLVVLALTLPAGFAWGFVRNFPQDILVGEFKGVDQGEVIIGKRILQLSPAAKIRDQSNRIVMPGSVQGSGWVAYTLDPRGQVWSLWILSNEEIDALYARGYSFK